MDRHERKFLTFNHEANAFVGIYFAMKIIQLQYNFPNFVNDK